MRSKVAEELSKVHYVAITTDSWTSQATISYLTITVHGIDEKWNLLSRVLQTREFTQPHDGEHIKEIIR
jgi:hypothetical protein